MAGRGPAQGVRWLVIIILMLGYIPDRAYYFTVNRTLQLGLLVWSPINSARTRTRRCRVRRHSAHSCPGMSRRRSWRSRQARTDGRAVQLGTKILYIGGSGRDDGPVDVYVAQTSGTGNFDKWADGPALPEPRSDAAMTQVSGTVYVIGGFDADGAPTTSVYSIDARPRDGRPRCMEGTDGPARSPNPAPEPWRCRPRTASSSSAARAPTVPSSTTFKSTFDKARQAREMGVPGTPRSAAGRRPRRRSSVTSSAIYGGHDDAGPVGAVQRGSIGLAAAEGLPDNPDEGKVVKWDIDNAWNLPGARTMPPATPRTATLLPDGWRPTTDGPRTEVYWAIPNNDGTIPEWKHLAQSDLPYGLTGGSALLTGPNAVLVGGETADGVLQTSLRANTAPQAPFFQLGPFGATVPALKIDGEIGQQLGYLNAAGAGTRRLRHPAAHRLGVRPQGAGTLHRVARGPSTDAAAAA